MKVPQGGGSVAISSQNYLKVRIIKHVKHRCQTYQLKDTWILFEFGADVSRLASIKLTRVREQR